jgi:hypothetical protein
MRLKSLLVAFLLALGGSPALALAPVGQFTADCNQPIHCTIVKGATAQVTFTLTADTNYISTAVPFNYQIKDENGNTIVASTGTSISTNGAGTGSVTVSVPSTNTGMYNLALSALPSDGSNIAAAVTRPAGLFTYAVVPDPAKRIDYGANAHFGSEGGFNNAAPIFPLLGWRWIIAGPGWYVNDAGAPGTFIANKAASNVPAAVTFSGSTVTSAATTNYVPGDVVVFSFGSGGAFPAGITACDTALPSVSCPFYVLTASGTTFTVATAPGGAAVVFSGSPSSVSVYPSADNPNLTGQAAWNTYGGKPWNIYAILNFATYAPVWAYQSAGTSSANTVVVNNNVACGQEVSFGTGWTIGGTSNPTTNFFVSSTALVNGAAGSFNVNSTNSCNAGTLTVTGSGTVNFAGYGSPGATMISPPGVAEMPQYCAAIATWFQQAFPQNPVDYYQMTWEPFNQYNISSFPPAAFNLWYSTCYNVIHGADRKAKVMGPTQFPDTSGSANNTLLSGLLSGGLGVYLDAFSMHPYSNVAGVPFENSSWISSITTQIAAVTAARGHAIPLVPTESAYTGGPATNYAANPTTLQQAEGDVRNTLLYLGLFNAPLAIAFYPSDGITVTYAATGSGTTLTTPTNHLDPSYAVYFGSGCGVAVARPFYTLTGGSVGGGTSATVAAYPGGPALAVSGACTMYATGAQAVDYGFYYDMDTTTLGGGANSKLGPKEIVPAYAFMTYVLDGMTSTGAVSGTSGTQLGYGFTRTHNGYASTAQALWDYSSSTSYTATVPAGVYYLCTWMGVCTPGLSSGTVSGISLGAEPVYIITGSLDPT